jgi:hypothetical protein
VTIFDSWLYEFVHANFADFVVPACFILLDFEEQGLYRAIFKILAIGIFNAPSIGQR